MLADDGRHQPGDDPLWNESWYLDFWRPDGSLGGYVRLGLYPNLGRSWYWACLVREGLPLVTVIEHEAPLPKPPGLELRFSGLWTDVVAGEALSHMSVGLEAFGLALDDPTEVYRTGRGDPVPLGFDLEWDTDGAVFEYDVTTRYEVPCRVHGEILVGQEAIELDGWGQRDHSWGVRDWWQIGWCWHSGRLDDGAPFHATIVDDRAWSIGYVGADAAPIGTGALTADLDDEGLARSARIRLDDLYLALEPVSWSPVLLTAPDGRVSRLARALVRYTAADGRTGCGWLELNQPQGTSNGV